MKKLLQATLLGTGTMLLATPALAQYFNSPSGNIYCAGDEGENGYVSCFIMDTTNKKPALPKPKSCDYDWGNDFGVGRSGKAHMNCYSDFAYDPNARTLGYGKSINGKGWTCTSQTTGMRCVNSSGRGFQLSKSKQTLF